MESNKRGVEKVMSEMRVNKDVTINRLSITYSQGADCCSEDQDIQEVTITTESSDLTDFYYLINTERWAIDDVDDFVDILIDFKKRMQ